MPIPLLTPKILASTKPMLDGWSLVVVTAVRQQSKDGAVNTWFDFEVEKGPQESDENVGKTTAFMVSGNGLAAGIDTLCRAYTQFLSAITGLSGEEVVGKEISDDFIIGKRVWAKIGSRLQDNKSYPDFLMFCPATEIPF